MKSKKLSKRKHSKSILTRVVTSRNSKNLILLMRFSTIQRKEKSMILMAKKVLEKEVVQAKALETSLTYSAWEAVVAVENRPGLKRENQCFIQ